MKSKIELAREIAARSPARFVEIERTTRFTAYRNAMKEVSATAVLRRERERLIEQWQKGAEA